MQHGIAGGPDDPLRLSVGPVGQPAAAEPEHHDRNAGGVALRVVDPARLAGRCVDGGHLGQRGGEIERVTDHQRGALEPVDAHVAGVVADLECRIVGAEVVEVEPAVSRLPPPDDRQVADVLRGDLSQRRVFRATGVSRVAAPLAAIGALLCRGGHRRACERRQRHTTYPDTRECHPHRDCLL